VLSEKPWRAEAIARLLAGIFVCTFLGSLTLSALRFDPAAARSSPTVFYLQIIAAALALLGTLAAIAKPWTFENFKVRAAISFTCCFLGLAFAGIAQKNSGNTSHQLTLLGLTVAVLSFQGAAIPLIWIFTRQHGVNLRKGYGFSTGTSYAVMLGITAGLVFIPVGLGLQSAIAVIAKNFLKIDLAPQDALAILQLADSWLERIALGFCTIILVPLAEEGLFRGIFYPAIKRLGFPNAALWVTSLLFALIHFNKLSFIPLVVLAIVLVKLYERTDNLLACITCHATFNALNFIMLFVQKYYADQPAS